MPNEPRKFDGQYQKHRNWFRHGIRKATVITLTKYDKESSKFIENKCHDPEAVPWVIMQVGGHSEHTYWHFATDGEHYVEVDYPCNNDGVAEYVISDKRSTLKLTPSDFELIKHCVNEFLHQRDAR